MRIVVAFSVRYYPIIVTAMRLKLGHFVPLSDLCGHVYETRVKKDTSPITAITSNFEASRGNSSMMTTKLSIVQHQPSTCLLFLLSSSERNKSNRSGKCGQSSPFFSFLFLFPHAAEERKFDANVSYKLYIDYNRRAICFGLSIV